jgi:voltage-dependent anion channel protein 2
MAAAFKDLGKTYNDLLTKDYKVGKNTVELKKKYAGVTFTPTANKAGSKPIDGSLKAEYTVAKGMKTECTLDSAGVFKGTFEAADVIAKGMTCKVDGGMPKLGEFSSCALETVYKTGPYRCQANCDLFKGDVVLNASAKVMKDLGIGAECGYSTKKSALTKYAAACQYVQPDFTVSMKLAEVLAKPGMNFTGGVFYKASGDLSVGCELAKAASKSAVDLALGCQYKYSKDTTVKAKADSDGKLCCSVKQTVSPMTLLTLAAELDTTDLQAGKHKFGMIVNITP